MPFVLDPINQLPYCSFNKHSQQKKKIYVSQKIKICLACFFSN